jgi:hypothetical protein
MLRYYLTSGPDERGFETVLQEKELEVATSAVQGTRDRERMRAARAGGFVQNLPATSGHGGA